MTTIYVNAIAGGVLMGVVYALIAMGLTIIFGVMRIVNFAHGEMVVAGMYIGYLCHKLLGLPAVPAALIAAIIMFAFGYALQRLVVNRFIRRPQHAQFILFIGLALAITGLHLMIFGADSLSADATASFDTVSLGWLRVDYVRLQAAAMAALIMAALAAFLQFSIFGQAIRAAADNLAGAAAIGLRIPAVFAVTSGIGVACAGAAGALITPIFDTQPFLAVDFTLLAFITVIVGGLGSLPGALLGGILIGASESVAALLIAPAMKSLFSYVLLLLVILLKPQGLFGSQGSR